MTFQSLKLGVKVRTDFFHWLRPGQIAEIVEHQPERGTAPFLCQFETKYPGGGIDGDKLWLEASRLTVIGKVQV